MSGGLLVFGRSGQVAMALQGLADVTALGRDQADLSDPAACAAAIHTHRPRAVINAAAFTGVDAAETQEPLATVINAEAPAAMAQACAVLDIPFVHISTDYVFAGTGDQPWQPDDDPAPVNAYGRSKLAGERAIRAVGGCHAILRTAWVFSAHGGNFVKTMLRLSQTCDHLDLVADQIGGPTPADAVAGACLTVADHLIRDPDGSGTYHISGAPDVSWCDFAGAIFAAAGRNITVRPIPTAAYPTPAARPANARLDCSRTETTFGLVRPDWRAALPDIIHRLEQLT